MGERGFRIIGVTGEAEEEGRAKTEEWIADKNVEYGYCYDPNRELATHLGIRGIPHGVLVDPIGTIVWSGYPPQLTEAVIEKHLGDALPMPMWEWPESLADVRTALSSGKLGPASRAAKSLEGSTLIASILGLIEKRADGAIASLVSMADALDVQGGVGAIEAAKASLEGMPQADKIAEIAKRFETDEAKAALVAQDRVDEINDTLSAAFGEEGGKPPAVAELEAWAAELSAISEKFEGKAPAADADGLNEMLGMMIEHFSSQEEELEEVEVGEGEGR